MVYLGLAVACSLAIAMIFKVGERRGLDRISLVTVNYAAAGALGAALLAGEGAQQALRLNPPLLALGVGTGALFILGFVLLSLAVRAAGMALAAATMRLAVAVPFVASWLVWGETPSAWQVAGLVVAGGAFLLLAQPRRPRQAGPDPGSDGSAAGALATFGVLAALFVVGGAVDVSMKAFDEEFASANSRALFLLMVFGVAFLIGAAVVLVRGLRSGRWPRGAALGWGAVLGLVNYGSAAFFLEAVALLPGPFVFPVNNLAIVAGAALLGVWVWGEQLSRANRTGLALAGVALVLLGL